MLVYGIDPWCLSYLDLLLQEVDLLLLVLELLLELLVEISESGGLTLAVQVPLFQGRDPLLLQREKST